jgi:hypothetical protein
MAVKRWVGRAQKTAQAGTITIGTYDATTTYKVGIPNTTTGKVVSTLGTGGTNITTAAALAALLQASLEPEFLEITWTTPTTAVISYAVQSSLAGTPVTVAVAVSGGTGTISTATTQANVSPNDVNNANNWDTGTLPVNSDTIVFDFGAVDATWNIDQLAALTGITMYRRREYTGKIGLPEYNASGYFEYRATELQLAGGTFNIEQPVTDAIAQIKINHGATAGTLNLVGDGPSTLLSEQMWIRGTSASSVYNVEQATLAIAPVDNTVANLATLKCQNSTVRAGVGVVFATSIVNTDSELEVNSNLPASFTQYGSAAVTWVKQAATGSSPSLQDGVMYWMSTGTLTTPTVGSDASVDFSKDNRARTISGSVQMFKGSTWNDPWSTALATFVLNGCQIGEVTINYGAGRTVAVS